MKKVLNFSLLELQCGPEVARISKKFQGVTASLSGGPDSTLLFLFLCHLAKQKKIVLQGAIHFNFCLRAEESDGDQAFVEKLCNRFSVPLKCFVMSEQKTGISAENVQLWARNERRKVYGDMCKTGQVVTLGHTLDDQAETVLMRLGRGTGPKGLGGMKRLSAGLWRPLLGITKAQIEGYLSAHGEAARRDSSNDKVKYRRNQIRHQVMPPLNSAYPRASEHVAALAEEMQGVYKLAQRQVAPFLSAARAPLGLDVSRLAALDPGARRFALRQLCAGALTKSVGGGRKERSDGIAPWVEALDKAVVGTSGTPGRLILTLSPEVDIRVSDGRLWIQGTRRPIQHERYLQSKGCLGASYIDAIIGPGAQVQVPIIVGEQPKNVVLANNSKHLNVVRLQTHKSGESLRFKGWGRKVAVAALLGSRQPTDDDAVFSFSIGGETVAIFDGSFFNSINAQGEKIAYCGLLEIRIE